MSKELIEKLRKASYSASHGEMADLLQETADALEAKAAPVAGERDAYEAWKLSMKPYGFDGFDAYQAGADYQRAKQPQSAEAVAWTPATTYPPFGELVLTNIGPAYMTEKQPGVWFERLENLGIGRRLAATSVKQWRKMDTPQPSAGVVMPERITLCGTPDIAKWERGWNACLDEFARLNGKEVGRG